jgi:hypothetical protein
MKKVWMLCLLAAVCFTGQPVESQDASAQLSIKVVVDLEDVVNIEGAVYAEDNEDVQKKNKRRYPDECGTSSQKFGRC